MLAPCPRSEQQNYTHLARFVRQAPDYQRHQLWQTLALALEQRINAQPTWLSTAGLGVYWLHIRLDKIPKYYHFQPYKIFDKK
ncbi:MAG: hypothetical protein MUE85_19630 [Microscillaceae bacterium]|nr:hypothetical protein [Microscillaceae bacterium]